MKQFVHKLLNGYYFINFMDVTSDKNQPLANISFDRIDKGG